MTTFTGHLTDAQAQRLVDGALSAAEAAEVEAHEGACLECQALVESYRVLAGALDELPVPALPADFTASVLAAVDARERAAARERRLAAGILGAVAAALVALLLLAGPGAWAPAMSSAADQAGAAASVLRIGAGFLPAIVSALRLQIALAVAAFALPLLVALARLMPAPPARTESA
jgi:anti-sigma factor RsiW